MADGTQSVDLGQSLDITGVSQLHGRLAEALQGGGRVALDGSRIERVDAAGIQLLVAFAHAAAERGGWHWQGGTAPQPVADAAAQLGLDAELAREPGNQG